MIRVILNTGETLEANDNVFDLTPLGVRHDDRNAVGNKTGEWTIYPWSAVKVIHRIKDTPTKESRDTPRADDTVLMPTERGTGYAERGAHLGVRGDE